jgi:hypothetical protein
MTLIIHQLQEQNYTNTTAVQQQFIATIRQQLQKKKELFTYFATVTWAKPISLADAVVQTHQALRVLGQVNDKKYYYFYSVALAPSKQFNYAQSYDDGTINDDIIADWHVHLLLGNMRHDITAREISTALRRKTGCICHVTGIYDVDGLINYVTETSHGNTIGQLMQTNIKSIDAQRCEAQHTITR